MQNKLGCAKGFLLLVTQLAAGSVLAEIAVGIFASPSQAASLALSQASIEFNNFSHQPLSVQTLTDTNTLAIAPDGSSTNALATAEATFVNNPVFAYNSSLSTAAGEGTNYLGLAKSESQVIGNFSLEPGQTFSFDFAANLNLHTSIDDVTTEIASSYGELKFFLVDSKEPTTIYDSFVVSGKLTTPGDNDFLNFQNGDSITFNQNPFTAFGGTQEDASTSFSGGLKHSFDNSTSVTLIETKTTQAGVQAGVQAVPEEANALASLLLFGFMGFQYTRKKHVAIATGKAEIAKPSI